jgi:hypothetical protein
LNKALQHLRSPGGTSNPFILRTGSQEYEAEYDQNDQDYNPDAEQFDDEDDDLEYDDEIQDDEIYDRLDPNDLDDQFDNGTPEDDEDDTPEDDGEEDMVEEDDSDPVPETPEYDEEDIRGEEDSDLVPESDSETPVENQEQPIPRRSMRTIVKLSRYSATQLRKIEMKQVILHKQTGMMIDILSTATILL